MPSTGTSPTHTSMHTTDVVPERSASRYLALVVQGQGFHGLVQEHRLGLLFAELPCEVVGLGLQLDTLRVGRGEHLGGGCQVLLEQALALLRRLERLLLV
eukprot:2871956-Rhodomonas_salina.1